MGEKKEKYQCLKLPENPADRFSYKIKFRSVSNTSTVHTTFTTFMITCINYLFNCVGAVVTLILLGIILM
jgi:hypothetical protein